jgi:predicted TIM-barrel fold metal-dependent hydrolase
MRLPQEIQLTIADMITGGVFQRFPRLKIVSAENDVSWIPHFMYRIDHAYDRLRHLEGLTLPMLPSEYMRQNVWATFQFENSTVAFTSQAYSPERMMWSSDYPHTDSPWPRSREFIADALQNLSTEDATKITSTNAAQLYGIN